jgi:hypothetical protein
MTISVTLINLNLFFRKEHDKDYRKEKTRKNPKKRKEIITESIIDEEVEGVSITVVNELVIRSREFLKTL